VDCAAPKTKGASWLANGLLPFAVLAACLRMNPGARAQGPTAWPKRLVYAAGIVPRGMNPLLDRAGWNEASSVILCRLFRPDHEGGIEGDLVGSYSVADGRRYILELRKNAYWHDGAPFTADDVEFTWRALFDPKTETSLDLNQASLESFKKTGTHSFMFVLKAPDTGFLAALTEIPVLPAHKLRGKDINGDALDREPVGTGPYKLVAHDDWRRPDATARLARHEKYHGPRPAFEELLLKVIADDDARARVVAEGQADLGHVKPPHVEILRARGRRVLRMRTGAWRGMPLNLRRPALADVRVRQAIDLAIDREAILREALQGYGEAGYSPIPPASWAFRATMNVKRHDPERAAALLEESGWKKDATGRRVRNGQLLRLEMIVWKDEFFRRTAAERIKQQLGALGIRVGLHMVDGTMYNRLAENMGTEYDAYIGGWGGLLDPGDNLYKKYHSRGSQNRTGYSNPQVDAWLEEARRTTDREQAVALYEKIVAQITREAVSLPLAYPDYLFALRPELAGIEEYTLDSWYELTKYAAEWKPAEPLLQRTAVPRQ
jgi:peptide/nickel transport system substrate-binding protein